MVPTKGDRIYGFSNRWYEEAFEARERRTLPGGREINVFPLPYFIATKIEAYRDRGKGDFREAMTSRTYCDCMGFNSRGIHQNPTLP